MLMFEHGNQIHRASLVCVICIVIFHNQEFKLDMVERVIKDTLQHHKILNPKNFLTSTNARNLNILQCIWNILMSIGLFLNMYTAVACTII